MSQCVILTKSGAQCKRNAEIGRIKCASHRSSLAPSYFSAQHIELIRGNNLRSIILGLTALNKIQTEDDVTNFLNADILTRVIDLLSSPHGTVKDRAIWVLTNLSAQEAPAGSAAIWNAYPNMPDRIHTFLVEESPSLVGSMMNCVSNIASSDPAFSQSMIRLNYQRICTDILIDPHFRGANHKNALFLLFNLSKFFNKDEAAAVLTQLSLIPPIILGNRDLATDLLWTLNFLYDKTDNLMGFNPSFLTDNLESKFMRHITPALRIIGNICSGKNSELIYKLLKGGLLKTFHTILKTHEKLNNDILWIFSNLAVEDFGAIEIIEEPGLLLDIVQLIPKEINAIWIISNLAKGGSSSIITALNRCGCGLALVRQIGDINNVQTQLILEGIQAMIEKGGSLVYLPLSQVNLKSKLEHMRAASLSAKNIEICQAILSYIDNLPDVQLAPIVRDIGPVIQTSAATLALSRMSTMLARGALPEPVDVSDLLFTGSDIAFIMNHGYRFTTDGKLVLN
jgi:hypothetical protein